MSPISSLLNDQSMINRELQQMTWDDVQRLVIVGREEDDAIEFKRSFKAGDNYLGLTDKEREQSLDSLVREVLAFLNTRGGDVVIGVKEADSGAPAAVAAPGILNASESSDRIARGLAALIEPAQTNIGVRAVTNPDDPDRGVIIIRAQPSVRAPHRSKRTRECYVRRGSESVPMAMDEIQDLTINRTRLRLEQQQLLGTQFLDFIEGRAEHQSFSGDYLHFRVVLQPFLEQTITIDDAILGSLGNPVVPYYNRNGDEVTNDVAFRELYDAWRPFLRGQKREHYDENVTTEFTDFMYSSKRIKESGIVSFDFAASSHFEERPAAFVHFEWVAGFLAQVCRNIMDLSGRIPAILPGTLRLGIHSSGEIRLSSGRGLWSQSYEIPSGIHFIPDFVIEGENDLREVFYRVQSDLFALAGRRLDHPYTLERPQETS